MEHRLPMFGGNFRLLGRNGGLALALLALAVFLYYDFQTIYVLLKFAIVDHGAQADWVNLVAAGSSVDPYAVGIGFRWSPIAAWLLKPVVAGGWWLFVGAHFAVLALIRDWRVVVLMLGWWPFWNDVVHGNVVTFAFVAAWLALSGSRYATWVFYVMAVLMPRPIMLPVLVWLLWKRPETRRAFAAIFVVHATLVLGTGLGNEWVVRLLITPGGEMLHPANFGPTRFLGAAWIPVGVLLAGLLLWRGRVGLASMAAQPYLFPYYMMFVLLELRPHNVPLNRTSEGKREASPGEFVTQDPRSGVRVAANARRPAWLPDGQLIVRIFFLALGGLLVGYMFFGRGFAHIGIGPVYVGDVILILGMATAAFVWPRPGNRAPFTLTVALLLAFIALGALRTLPYLENYGLDALRDGVLWGYAAFALIVYLLADRTLTLAAFRAYGWVVPVFALWLPICWNLFAASSAGIDPLRPGSFVPFVFFKGGDMAVHSVGAVGFLVLGASGIQSVRTFIWRLLIGLPLLWTVFVAGTSNRGALLTAAVGIVAIAVLGWRSRNWLPLLAATAVFVIALVLQGVLSVAGGSASTPSVERTDIHSSGAPTHLPPAQAAAPQVASLAAPTSARTNDGPAGTSSMLEARSGDLLAVDNPGFELGPLNNGTIEGWTIRANGPHNVVAGGAYKGARFASMQNVDKAFEDTITSNRIPFDDGSDIAVSVWVKAIAGRPILETYVNWYDSSGSLISSAFVHRLDSGGARTWQECAGAVAAPANTAQAELVFYEASGTATIGLDEVTVRSGDYPELQKGRPATIQQMIENLLSIFGPSSDGGLEGSKQFRLAWWGAIVDYTVFGDYFWTGKGFGINLADADGFQSLADHSLRSPHNSEMTVLARMGVPGLVLWVLLQGAFGVGLLRATFAHRRAGDIQLAALGGLIVAYWVAMLVDTSFDPYLEGPQGGIWFWALFGLGLVIMRLSARGRPA